MPPQAADLAARSLPPCLGRTWELAAVERALTETLGGRSSILLVSGEAGIGKTRLLQEVVRMTMARGAQVLSGTAVDDSAAPPFSLWRTVLRELLARASLDQAMRPSADLIAQITPGPTASAATARDTAETLDATRQRFAVFEAVALRIRALAAERPVAILLDDIHWADAPSLRLLEHVARGLVDTRTLIVVAHRDASAQDRLLREALVALARLQRTRRLELGGLDEADVGVHLAAVCGRSFTQEIVRRVADRTRGNPFYVTEYGRLLEAADTTDEAAADITRTVPRGVRDVFFTRVSRLSPDCRELLDVSSVFGSTPTPQALARLLGETSDRVLELVEEAAAAGILVADPDSDGAYSFGHDLARDTIYSELPPIQRARLHLRIAEQLERTPAADMDMWISELAHHRLRAAAFGGDAEAASAAERAAELALAHLAFEEAARLYLAAADAAAASGASGAVIARLLIGAARGQYLGGDLEHAAATCRQAAAVATAAGNPELLAGAALVLEAVGDETVSRVIAELCDDALDRLAESELALRSRVLAQRASAAHYLGDEESVDRLSRAALNSAEHSGDDAAMGAALRARQAACGGPEGLEEREHIAARMRELAEHTRQPIDELWARLWQFDNLMQRGRLGEAREEIGRLAVLVERIDQPLAHWHLERCRFAVTLAVGDFAAARTAIAAGDRYARAAGDLALWRRHLQESLIAEATGAECASTIAAVEELASAPVGGLTARWLTSRVQLSKLALAFGQRDDAERHYAQLPAVDAVRVMPAMITVATASRSLAAAELGRRHDCSLLYQRMLPYADQFASSSGGAVASAGSMELFLGACAFALRRLDVAVRHLERAVQRNDAAGMRRWAAESRWWLARALLGRGRTSDTGRALELVTEGRATAMALGMAPLLKRLDDLEPALRSRTRRGRLLTEREEEIARFVAQGLTSREIGDTMHISARTVDNHVQHVLDKLDLRSRSQIAAWVASGLVRRVDV